LTLDDARDGATPNIMMDATTMFPEGFHPAAPHRHPIDILRPPPSVPRRETTVRYYLIDFGISVRYEDKKSRGKITGADGRERTTPELSDTIPYDPFPVDIYVAGKVLQTIYVSSLKFLSLSPGSDIDCRMTFTDLNVLTHS
jgi:hypothetical protein